jgi:hypothetical protein
LHQEDFSQCGDLVQQDIAADPSCPPGSWCEGFSLFNDFANKEVLWHNKEVRYLKFLPIVIQQHKVGIVACGEAVAHSSKCAIEHFSAKLCLLALELVFLIARCAEEIRYWLVISEFGDA